MVPILTCIKSFSMWLVYFFQDPRSCAELRCGFQQCLQYWQHPSLPWLSLFPRMGAKRSFSGKSTPWAQDATLQQSLMSEWSVTEISVCAAVPAKLCLCFLMCRVCNSSLFSCYYWCILSFILQVCELDFSVQSPKGQTLSILLPLFLPVHCAVPSSRTEWS